jgi:hypothetical protein
MLDEGTIKIQIQQALGTYKSSWFTPKCSVAYRGKVKLKLDKSLSDLRQYTTEDTTCAIISL